MLLNLDRTLEQHENMKIFLVEESTNNNTLQTKTSNTNMITEVEEDSETSEIVGVVFTQSHLKNPMFYVSMKIMENIAHCCHIDGGLCPNSMSKTIMEELGLSCTNENPRNMLDFNKQHQSTIKEIEYVTLVMCSHP